MKTTHTSSGASRSSRPLCPLSPSIALGQERIEGLRRQCTRDEKSLRVIATDFTEIVKRGLIGYSFRRHAVAQPMPQFHDRADDRAIRRHLGEFHHEALVDFQLT